MRDQHGAVGLQELGAEHQMNALAGLNHGSGRGQSALPQAIAVRSGSVDHNFGRRPQFLAGLRVTRQNSVDKILAVLREASDLNIIQQGRALLECGEDHMD